MRTPFIRYIQLRAWFWSEARLHRLRRFMSLALLANFFLLGASALQIQYSPWWLIPTGALCITGAYVYAFDFVVHSEWRRRCRETTRWASQQAQR